MKKVKAPKKLSKAIYMALNDLAQVEKSKRYKVNMDEWHTPDDNGKICHVCFAGSVMAKSYGMNFKAYVHWGFVSDEWQRVFGALNYIRLGEISTALRYFKVDEDVVAGYAIGEGLECNVVDYQDNPELFKAQMLDIAEMLKVNGL